MEFRAEQFLRRRPKEHLILLLLSNDITRTTPTKPCHENSQDVSFGDVLILTDQETDGAWEPTPYFFWEGGGGPRRGGDYTF